MSYKGQYLIDGFSIFTLPDAGALKYIMKKQTTQDIKELIPATRDDGRLTIDEIFKLQFKGRAVLISDCKALPGFSATGAEIAAFNRSLLYAVSPSVVSAIWKIDDKPAAAFTDIFYRNLKNNESIADSLRVTQNEMIKLGYPPHDWAAFTLTGKY
jgi:CHAT domain-containing protein